MTLTIILEGSNNVGKTTIADKLETWLKKQEVNYTYFHDTEIYESVTMGHDVFDLDDLIDARYELYKELRDEYDVILLDRSFMSTILYNLFNESNIVIFDYISKELMNLIPAPDDKLLVFVLVRDSDDSLSMKYVDLSHLLLSRFHVQSSVINTYNDLEMAFKRIKDNIYFDINGGTVNV